MANHPTNCEHWQESISLMAAGCLSAEMQKELRHHLADCESCTERYSEIVSICNSLSQIRPAVSVNSKSIQHHLRRHNRRTIHRRLTYATLTASVLLCIAFAVSLLTSRFRVSDPQPVVSPAHSIQPVDIASETLSTKDRKAMPANISTPETETDSQFNTAWPLPTLIAYRQALSESEDALEIVMRRHEESIVFKPSDPRSLFKEFNP